MFKHILLPTDGSDLSQRAVDIGITLAASLGAKVLAYHAMEPFISLPYDTEMMAFPENVYIDQANEHAVYYLEQVRERAKAAHVACDAVSEFEHRPYEGIVRAARDRHCDLIVMGSHGRSGLDKLLLGSQANKLLLAADVPVLICH
ncbi:universal stress protein [Dyella sp. EPa41]|uniref:universal stress protein n=1 Tax=Dyella sp. EPa41 TaxID=1561194 RepID=UPI0019152770|nr:universal stress protein [Dyella sp. EPa41]